MTQDTIKKHYYLLNFTLIYFSLANILVEVFHYYNPPFHNTGNGLGAITVISFMPIIFIFLRSQIISLGQFKARIIQDLKVNFSKGLVVSLSISGILLLATYGLKKFDVVDMFHKENYFSSYAFVYLILVAIQEFLFRVLFWEMGYAHIMRLQERSVIYRCFVSSILFAVLHEAWGVKVVIVSFIGNMIFHWFYTQYRNMIGVIILHFVLGWAFFDFAVR